MTTTAVVGLACFLWAIPMEKRFFREKKRFFLKKEAKTFYPLGLRPLR
jgi:hypothetical protein